jgi:hypothetical protein
LPIFHEERCLSSALCSDRDNNLVRSHYTLSDDESMFINRQSSKIILRRGTVGNDSDGTPLLINHRGEAYRVNDTAVSLWNMCNGITFEDLFNEVLRISSGSQEDVRKSLGQMIQQLRKISVVELKELK